MQSKAKAVPIVLRLAKDEKQVQVIWPKTAEQANQAEPIKALLRMVRPADLFPKCLLFPTVAANTNDGKSPTELVFYEVLCDELHNKVATSLYLLYQKIPQRRAEMARINDEFAVTEKTRQMEHERNMFRVGTRYNFPHPQLRVASGLFCSSDATTLNAENRRRIVFALEEPNDRKAVVQRQKRQPSKLTQVMGKFVCLPNSVMRDDIEHKIYDAQWFRWVALKSNGLRFFLVVCTLFGSPMALLINRAGRVFRFGCAIPKSLSKGCIWDGELVHLKSGKFAFLVFDCLMVSGIPCAEQVYCNRLQAAQLAIDAWNALQDSEKDKQVRNETLTLLTKPIWSIDQVASMLYHHLPEYKTDGLILTANEPPVIGGFCSQGEILKVKRGCDNTVEFQLVAVIRRPNGTASEWLQRGMPFYLMVQGIKGGNNVKWGSMTLLPDNPSQQSVIEFCDRVGLTFRSGDARELLSQLHSRIGECRYNLDTKAWGIDLMRHDKTLPNTKSTADKTWQNIQENLTLADIFPPGSMSDALRSKIIEWDKTHATWDDHLNATPLPQQPLKQKPGASTDFAALVQRHAISQSKTQALFPIKALQFA